jgi:hypothetical protein
LILLKFEDQIGLLLVVVENQPLIPMSTQSQMRTQKILNLILHQNLLQMSKPTQEELFLQNLCQKPHKALVQLQKNLSWSKISKNLIL